MTVNLSTYEVAERQFQKLSSSQQSLYKPIKENAMIKDLVEKAHFNARAKGFWREHDHLLDLANEREACEGCPNWIVGGACMGGDTCLIGAYAENIFISNSLMLCVSELGEAVEALRKGDRDNFAEELADTCIRIFDLCGGLGIDLEKAITDKMTINASRPPKHGKQF